jgi:hypothetical protein
MAIYYLFAGIALLILGRKLFWLFTGLIGFLLGLNFAQQFFPSLSQPALVLIALGVGVLGAFLAVMLEKIAIGLMGFIAGGYLVYLLFPTLSIQLGNLIWLFVILGGILGAVLASSMFDWALILLSSAVGASVIATHLTIPRPFPTVIAIALFIVGLVIQGGIKSRE